MTHRSMTAHVRQMEIRIQLSGRIVCIGMEYQTVKQGSHYAELHKEYRAAWTTFHSHVERWQTLDCVGGRTPETGSERCIAALAAVREAEKNYLAARNRLADHVLRQGSHQLAEPCCS